jgi:hypothetical protein
MVLFQDIVEIRDLTNLNRGAMFLVVAPDAPSLAALPSIVSFSGTP